MVPAHQQTEDLLGFDSSQQHREQQQQSVIATNATVSITTSPSIAPNIVGLGKIEPSTQGDNINSQLQPKRKVIYVPTYSCNGGLDTKFNHYSRQAKPSHLHNLLTPDEYEREITMLNEKIKKTRQKKLDIALLATGALMIPLALWFPRHSKQEKRKRKLIEEGVWEFNERMAMDNRSVRMVWNRSKVTGTGESFLTIEESDNMNTSASGSSRANRMGDIKKMD